MFWGSVIFEFFGVLCRYIYQFVTSVFTKKKLKTFIELWKGPDQEDPVNILSYGVSNILIGFSVLMGFVLLTIYVF